MLDPLAKKQTSRKAYATHPSPNKVAARKRSRAMYALDPLAKKETSKQVYAADPSPKKAAAAQAYAVHPSPKKAAARKISKLKYKTNPVIKRAASILYYAKKHVESLIRSRNYYAANKEFVGFLRKARYVLSEPRTTLKNGLHQATLKEVAQ